MRVHDPVMEDSPWTEAELEAVFSSLPSGKSPRPTGIGYELIRIAWRTPILKARLSALMQRALKEGDLPVEYDYTAVIPGFKRGDPAAANNYRYLMMVNTLARVLGRLWRGAL